MGGSVRQDSHGTMSATSYAGALAFMVVMLAIHLLCPTLRFLVLRHQRRSWAFLASDLLYGFFLAQTLASWAVIAYQIVDQRNKSLQLKPSELTNYVYSPKYMKMYYLTAAGFNLELWTLKGVFLALYFALFSRLSRWWNAALYTTTALVVTTFITNFTLYLGWCHPDYRTWTTYPPHCTGAVVNPYIITLQFATNAATAMLILLLPVGVVSTLHLQSRLNRVERLGLALVFGCGALALSMSVARYIVMMVLVGRAADRPRYIAYQELLGIAELVTANVAFCLPSYRNFFDGTGMRGVRGTARWVRRRVTFGSSTMRSASAAGSEIGLEETRRAPTRAASVRTAATDDSMKRSLTRAHMRELDGMATPPPGHQTEAYALGLYALGYIDTPPWTPGQVSPEITGQVMADIYGMRVK